MYYYSSQKPPNFCPVHRAALYKQVLKTSPCSKVTTNEITRVQKSLWGPRLHSQAETQGTCSVLMRVTWFLHFWVGSGGSRIGSTVSYKGVATVLRS